jgi:two-component system response regulator VicR
MKKKVVLIQDNEDILHIMDHVLEEEGFDVTASLTTDPIDNIQSIDPDIVIVDDHIKGKVKGSQVIKELKSDLETEDIPAILTSTSKNLSQEAVACQADDFIEKPFEIDEVVEVVRKNID